jgi:hypothetical protein
VIKLEVVKAAVTYRAKENNSVTILRMGIASYEEMKSRTMVGRAARGAFPPTSQRSGSPPRSR